MSRRQSRVMLPPSTTSAPTPRQRLFMQQLHDGASITATLRKGGFSLVDGLVRRGWVQRYDESEGRMVYRLTPSGLGTLKRT